MSDTARAGEFEPENNNIILTGFMGAGKTSVGEACALLSGAPFLDTDELIEKKRQMTISVIFDRYGEEEFRAEETKILQSLLDKSSHCIISAGGGLPLRKVNRDLLKKLGTVVFLRVKGDNVLRRLAGDNTRPLLSGDNVSERVDAMLNERNPVYTETADIIIDTDNKTPNEIAVCVLKAAGWT